MFVLGLLLCSPRSLQYFLHLIYILHLNLSILFYPPSSNTRFLSITFPKRETKALTLNTINTHSTNMEYYLVFDWCRNNLQINIFYLVKTNMLYVGVEYVVSDSIFEKLPPEEQRLWHSHAYEVYTIFLYCLLVFCLIKLLKYYYLL